MDINVCYLCSRIGNTRDHFIPRKFLNRFWVDETSLFKDAITMKCCYKCNHSKGSKILFPPLSYNSWMKVELRRELLYNFNEFCKWVINTYNNPSQYFYDWINDYSIFLKTGEVDSIFNKFKIYVDMSTYKERGN